MNVELIKEFKRCYIDKDSINREVYEQFGIKNFVGNLETISLDENNMKIIEYIIKKYNYEDSELCKQYLYLKSKLINMNEYLNKNAFNIINKLDSLILLLKIQGNSNFYIETKFINSHKKRNNKKMFKSYYSISLFLKHKSLFDNIIFRLYINPINNKIKINVFNDKTTDLQYTSSPIYSVNINTEEELDKFLNNFNL